MNRKQRRIQGAKKRQAIRKITRSAPDNLYIETPEGEVVKAKSPEKWSEWFAKADRTVKISRITATGVAVSSVFRGVSYNHIPGKRGLYNTTVFSGETSVESIDTDSREKCLAEHDRLVQKFVPNDGTTSPSS